MRAPRRPTKDAERRAREWLADVAATGGAFDRRYARTILTMLEWLDAVEADGSPELHRFEAELVKLRAADRELRAALAAWIERRRALEAEPAVVDGVVAVDGAGSSSSGRDRFDA